MNLFTNAIENFKRLFGNSIPLHDPVLILALVLLIILFSPLLFRRFRIPGIIGLILAGVLIGPNTLHLIEETTSFDLFSNTGLLYIMFLAGLEMDLHELKEHRNKSLAFGAFTFFIPITIGFAMCMFVLHYSFWAALLLASMFSTHTLLSYPIVSNMGIIKNRAVQVTFGGTIITDSAVLILLGIITNLSQGNSSPGYWIKLVFMIGLLLLATLYLLPRVSRWFFRNLEGQGSSQYLFVLAMMFLSAFMADLAGIKAIVGAFLAGLAFNRIILHNSVLMNRLAFIGNTLFIPFFLISAGMLVDLRLFFVSTGELVFASILSAVALLTKFLAAQITGFIYKYTKYERRVMYGLSASHAAATLAVIKVGFDIGLLDQHALNGTIILILITCLVSSFVTERAARQLAIEEKDADVKVRKRPERILVPISNPENMQRLLEFALLIKDDKSAEPIYPLTVVEDDSDANKRLQLVRKAMETITEQLVSEKKIEILKKVDLNIVDGIARTAKAYDASHILLSSRAAHTTGNFLFGNVADNLLVKTEQAVLLARILQPLNSFARIVVRFTPNAYLELSFRRTARKVALLLKQLGDNHVVIGDEKTLEQFRHIINDRDGNFYTYKLISDNGQETEKELRTDDLLVIVSSRKQTVSYDFHTDNLQDSITKNIESQSFIVIYPELLDAAHYFNEMETAPFQENIELIRKAKDKLKDIFRRPA